MEKELNTYNCQLSITLAAAGGALYCIQTYRSGWEGLYRLHRETG